LITGTEGKDVRSEIDRLREDNADLRASARWWKALYEGAVTRATDVERLIPSGAPHRNDDFTDPVIPPAETTADANSVVEQGASSACGNPAGHVRCSPLRTK
jgi:hypothetical protein